MPRYRFTARRLTAAIMTKRYAEMGIADALARPWDYPTACRELAALLRDRFAVLPAEVKALIIRDMLAAFRALADVQTTAALPPALELLRASASQDSLSEEDKLRAASEINRSFAAPNKDARVQLESGPPFKKETSSTGPQNLSYDVLVRIFSFLDMRSLVAASLVSWSWNSCANDNKMWQTIYSIFFSTSFVGQSSNGPVRNSADSVSDDPKLDWKKAFRNKYTEYLRWDPGWRPYLRWSSTPNRALCQHCRSVLWLSNLTCAAPHHCPENKYLEIKLLPLLPDTVASCIYYVDYDFPNHLLFSWDY